MHVPEPIPTDVRDESFAGINYHIRGQLVPELQLELSGAPVMFEHHVLLWKEPNVEIEVRKLAKGIKRTIAGLDFFVTRATGPGRIAFSRDAAGQVIPIHLAQGQSLTVREHQFVAASDAIDYTYERVQGARNMLLGGSGIFVDKFTRRPAATRSSGCTRTATPSRWSSTPASRSTSSRAPGSTRTGRSRWRQPGSG